jgi:outer membrane protein OmpA-like peptidoglycan-associated protein
MRKAELAEVQARIAEANRRTMLSEKRGELAEHKDHALISHGVASERVTVMGYGSTRPVADNDSDAGRADNRRVEIVIQPKT